MVKVAPQVEKKKGTRRQKAQCFSDGRRGRLPGIRQADGVKARTGLYLVVSLRARQAGRNGVKTGVLSKSECWKGLHESEDNLAKSACGAGAEMCQS